MANTTFTVGQRVVLVKAPVHSGWSDNTTADVVNIGAAPEGKQIVKVRRGDGRTLNITADAIRPTE